VELTGKKRTAIVSVVLAGAFLASLGQSLLTSSIPVLSKAFRVSEVTGEWLTTSYILVLGIVSALTANLINRMTTRKLFLGVMGLFTAGCALSLFARNFYVLLASRIIQAIGAGVLLPLAQVVILSIYPRERHGRAFAIMGIAIAFAPAIGPTLAGVLLDWLGWQSMFYLMLILSVLILAGGFFFLQNVGERFEERLDILSALLYGAGFCALMLGVSGYSQAGDKLLSSLLPAAAGVLLLLGFVLRSLKLEHPLLKLNVFANRKFTLSFILIVICYLSSMAGVILLPLYLQTARGVSATTSGLVMLPGALSIFAANPVGGKLLDSRGPRPVAILGMALLAAGTAAFCAFGENTSLIVVAAVYCVRMFGMTLAMNPLTAYSVGGLKGAEVSHGNAIIASMRQMFGTLGASALVAITAMSSAGGKTDVHGINVSFGVQTVLYALGLILAVFCIKDKSSSSETVPAA